MTRAKSTSTEPRVVVGGVLGTGGMATVHLATMRGAAGFARTVAVKRMHPHVAADPELAAMFADEARLAARVRHPNVVPTFDVLGDDDMLQIVMEYVHGVTVAELAKLVAARGERIPPPVGLAIVRDALQGLHAAHEAVDESGEPLRIVHRDVSPQNILVGTDGIARVLDFGIAKARTRAYQTRADAGIRGKLAYMAPEQLDGQPASRSTDLFAASVVLWEVLTGKRLFAGETEAQTVFLVLAEVPAPSSVDPVLAPLDAVVLRGLARDPAERWTSAREMALALAEAAPLAEAAETAQWVEQIAEPHLRECGARVRDLSVALQADALDVTRTAAAVLSKVPVLAPAPRRRRARRGAVAAAVVIGLVALVVLLAPRSNASLPGARSPAEALWARTPLVLEDVVRSAPVASTSTHAVPKPPAKRGVAIPDRL